jgi:hypothetical protein
MSSLLSFGTTTTRNQSRKKSLKKSSTTKKFITVGHVESKEDYFKVFVRKMLEVPIAVRLFHWKTDSHATHKATDGLLGTLNEIIDKYVETLIGKTNIKIHMDNYNNLHIPNLENNAKLEEYIKSIIEFLLEIHKKLDMEKDTDLLNMRDEIIGDLNRFLYLLRLK